MFQKNLLLEKIPILKKKIILMLIEIMEQITRDIMIILFLYYFCAFINKI